MQKIFIGFCIVVLGVLSVILYNRTNVLSVAPLSTNTIETDFYTITVTQPTDASRKFPELFAVTQNAIALFEQSHSGLTFNELEWFGRDAIIPYNLQIDTTIATTSETVSYRVSLYEYTGGAHGITAVQAFTYDKRGRFIDENVLFGDTDWRSLVSAYAYTYLKEKLGDQTTDQTLREGTSPEGNNLDVWYLRDTDVVFVFGQYQIGPYVLGIQEVAIPREQLDDVIRYNF